MLVKLKKKPSLKKTYVDLATQSLREEIKVLKLANKQLKSALSKAEAERRANLEKLQELRIVKRNPLMI